MPAIFRRSRCLGRADSLFTPVRIPCPTRPHLCLTSREVLSELATQALATINVDLRFRSFFPRHMCPREWGAKVAARPGSAQRHFMPRKGWPTMLALICQLWQKPPRTTGLP